MKQHFFFALFLFLIVKLDAQTLTVGSTNADYLTDGVSDEIEIQAAIDALAGSNGGIVFLNAQTFNLGDKIVPKSNVQLIGMGINQTILKSTHTHGHVLFNNHVPIDNFHLKQLTIDPSSAQNASGVRLEYATNCSVTYTKFVNVTCDGWHLVFGIQGGYPEVTELDFSRNNLVDHCEFDGHQGSLEMLLVFNSKNTTISNSIFKNKTRGCPTDGNAPVVGLWQRTDSILIENCQFINNESSEAFYYSSSSFNTIIKNCQFNNTGSIRGTNDSDWEEVNELYDYAENLKIERCDFTGGMNDRTKMAIQLGGIKNVLVKDCNITAYEEGITFQGGSTSEGNGHQAPKHWAIINTVIKNSNPNDDVHGLHGGCLFTEGTNLNGFFICGRIFDDQAMPTMRYPIIFEYLNPAIYPTQTYDSIFILGTELSPISPYNQIQFNHQVVRGDDLIFEDCAITPSPSFCDLCDTPQSMATYADLMDDYDAITAQKMVDLANLSLSANPNSVCSFDNANLIIDNQSIAGTYLGTSITTQNTVTTDGSTILKAKNSIVLSTGFHAQSGSQFQATIADCSTAQAMTKQGLSNIQHTNLTTSKTLEQPKLTVFPNPFFDQLTLDYFLPTTGTTSILMTNTLGESIRVYNQGIQEKGFHQMIFSTASLPKGTYFVLLRNEGATKVQKIIRL